MGPLVKKRFGQILIGQTFMLVVDQLFDNILYPAVILKYGAEIAFVIMTFATGLLCFSLIIWYEKMKIDWLGVDVLEEGLFSTSNYDLTLKNRFIVLVHNKTPLELFALEMLVGGLPDDVPFSLLEH